MENDKELILVIRNTSYDRFNGCKVKLVGFEKIPFRFSEFGWAGGKHLLYKLYEELGEFSLIISRVGRSKIILKNKPVEITINFDDVLKIRSNYWQQSKQCGEKAISQSLSDIFPEVFPDEFKMTSELPAEIRAIAPSKKQLKEATSYILRSRKYTLREQDTLQFITSGNVLHTIHLTNILNEFEERLSQVLTESDWQKFFERNMLVLNPGYIKRIPKANITAIIAELPDFLLISIEGYVDVYEIKLPSTELLSYDNSHNSYYWSSDITKAIAQTENYISSLDGDRDSLEKKIESKYDIKLSILRPRGYIIAGTSTQLNDKDKNKYFRLLNESLKNTCIMPYDTFLNNFKNLSKTLLEIT